MALVMTVAPSLSFAQSVPPGVTQIVPDGRTATTVTTNGSVSTVTTNTVSGPNAFNSFSQFRIGAGNTGNLILPNGTSNLINLMNSNDPAVINGVLNSYKNGQIGGNVYFAAPGGFVVGRTGVVNVGSLNVSTPTREFVDGVISPSGQINQGSVNNLLAGTVPLSPDGNIRIRGRINAIDAVRLTGQNVFVGNNREAINRVQATKFASTVNSKGLRSASAIVVRNGSIQIVAADTARINGRLSTASRTKNGGNISVTAREIKISEKAKLSAASRDGNAGQILVYATDKLEVKSGAQVDVSSAEGNGGFVDLSAKNVVTLGAIKFKLAAPNGAGGTVLVDPADIIITGDGQNYQSGNSLYSAGGNIILTATDSITVTSTGVIDSRNVADHSSLVSATNPSLGNSGNITLNAPTIKIFGKILADVYNTAGNSFTAGDVTLNAVSSVNIVAGLATANTLIQIGSGAQIWGKNITLNSNAEAISSYTDSTLGILALIGQSAAAAAIGLNGGYVAGTATSTVTVENNTTINGSGNVTISSSAKERAVDPAVSIGGASPVTVAVTVGEINGTVNTTIKSGANITAGGNLNITAQNDAGLNVIAVGLSSDAQAAITVAYGTASVQTNAIVESGANLSVGGNLYLGARNINSFSVSATSYSLGQSGKAGAAVAYSEISTAATATLGANIGNSTTSIPGSVTVEANSGMPNSSSDATNTTSATAAAGNPILIDKIAQAGASAVGKAFDDFVVVKAPASTVTDLKFAGALSLASSDQSATASIAATAGGTAPSIYAAGNVAVIAKVSDVGVSSLADASTNSQEVSDRTAPSTQSAAKTGVSFGVAVGTYGHHANAFIGQGVTICCGNLGVSATTEMPITINWLTYDSLGTWLAKLNGNLGTVNQVLTSYANAASQAQDSTRVGAANYFEVDNTATAWVASNATITRNSATAPASWSTTLADGSSLAWDQAIAVQAATRTASIDIGGNFSWLGLTGSSGQQNGNGQSQAEAIGGATNVVIYKNRTYAGISDGVTINSNGALSVSAKNENAIVAVSPTSGAGNAESYNGIVAVAIVDDVAHASIANSAKISATAVNINASEALSVFSVGGAVASAQTDAVGIVIAVNQITGNTAAYIGDNRGDITGSRDAANDPGSASAAAGYVDTDNLQVQAQTYGVVTAASVAATKASGSPSTGSTFLNKFITAVNKLRGKVDSAGSKGDDAAGGATPKLSIDVAGSSSVNVSAMTTDAYINGAVIDKKTGTNATSVQAVNNTILQTGAGSAALDMAKVQGSKSAAIAGALAIGLSGNATRAYVNDSQISSASAFSALALSGGEETTVALALALNQSADQSKAASVAGSVSIASITDFVAASVVDSTIAAASSITPTYGSNSATVAAYQTTDIAIGGGSLYKGGKTGFGFAFTYGEIVDPDGGKAVDARVSGSSITGFYNATVSASDASRIGAGAGLFGQAQNALAVSMVITEISPTISAVVDGGSTITVSGTQQSYQKTTPYYVSSTSDLTDTANIDYTLIYQIGSYRTYSAVRTDTVQVTSDVTVSSNGARNATFDAAIANASQVGATPVNSGLIDFSGSAVEAANSQSGASIIAVAGVVQGGQNSLGFAITANTIHQSNIAQITHAIVTAQQGDVVVTADSSATILGVAVGAALSGNDGAAQGKFAGLSSTAINQINNSVSATIGDGTATTTNTTIDTTDVLVRATDGSSIRGAAGTLAISTSGSSAGLSIVYDKIANAVVAAIDGAKVTASGDVMVNAASDASVLTVALGIAASKQVGVAGSVAVSLLDTNVTARITGGADVSATNNAGILAHNYDVISVVSGAAGIGATSTGVGISVVVNEVGGTTSAFISGPSTQVDAYAAGSSSMLVNSGTLNNAFNVSSADSPNLTPPDLSEQQRSVHGLAVVATSHQAVDGVAVTLGLAAGGSAFAINPETTLLGGQTLAYIDGAQIDMRAPTNPSSSTAQGIFVGASSQTYARSLLLSVAASGGSGAGAVAVAATRFDRETYAYITNSNVGTSSRRIGDVAINASSAQVAQYTAVGAAVSGSAFGGSMIVNVFDADTQAYLTHGSLYASSLGVAATSQNGQNASAGAGAASASNGVAASFVIGASQNNTLAYIGDNSAFTSVDLAGPLSVSATSHNTFYSLAAGGTGAGGNGIAGMVDFTVLTDTTKAIINNASVTQTGVGSGVTVGANEDVTIRVTTGSGALGGSFGIGAAINVVVLKSQIAGAIIDSNVTTSGAVAVTATGTKDIDMQAITFGIGGTAGLAGAISLLIAGINAPGDAVNQIGSTIVVIDNETSNVGADNGISQSSVPGNIDTAGSRPADYSLATALNGGNDAVSAEITRGTTTAGSVNVSASGSVKTKNLATGVGIGGVAGVGAALGFSLVYDTIAASVSHGVVHASTVTVNASMQDNGGHAVEVDAYAGAGGAAAAIGAAVAIGTVNNTVTAQLGGTTIGPDAAGATTVSLNASDSSSVYTQAVGAAIATDGMALGASIAVTTKSSLIYAAVLEGASISGYSGMTVTAAGSGSLGADSAAGAGGVFAGTGAISTATDHENVIAEIGTVAANAAIGAPASTAGAPSITVGAQGLYVHATSTPDVDTSAIGVAVGAAGVGASVATSTVDATVSALVDPYSSITTQAITSGTPAVISVGQLKVIAEMLLPSSGTSAHAFSAAGTGGFVIGANATVSTATNNATVHAAIGDYVVLPMGDVIVQANSTTSQSASTTGVAAGFVGLGVAIAFATADTNTTAELGQSVTSSNSRTGNLLVNANGKDTVSADATSGVGGVIAGNGAGANPTINSSTTVNIGQDSNFTAGTIGLVAWHISTYKGSVNTVNASLAGASGAAAVNDITSDVSVNIHKNVRMMALMNVCGSSTCAAAVNVVAQNDFVESGTGDTATGAGGGVLNGAAVFGVTHLNGTASITIDDSDDAAHQTIITAGTDLFSNPGGIRMTAFSTFNATDTVSLVTGGAITSAGVNTTVDATLSNSVTVGNYARLQTFGSIGIGTFTQAAVNTGAYVSTYGLAAVGSAAAYVYLTDNEKVTIKDNATLTAFGNVNLTPGLDPGGNYQSVLMVGTSDAQAYVRGLIAIPVATGETKLTTSADLSIGSSYIGAGQNVTLGAYEGTQAPVSHGDAHGYILFLIPVTTSDSSARSVQSSSVTLASGANVVAGQFYNQQITIDCGATACGPNSTPTVRLISGAPVTYVDNTSAGNLFNAADYVSKNFDPDVSGTLLVSIANTSVPAFQLSPLFASGGSVTINARTIIGTGTVTAYGSPKISVVANSPAYLLFNGAYIPDIIGGQVSFTGAATDAPQGMTINRVAGDGVSSISIVNNFTGNTGSTGVGPAMLFAGDVTNLGGTITISNLGGSYGSIANTNAQSIELNVPNGAAVISNPGPGGYYGPSNAFGGFDGLALQYPGGAPAGGTAGANIGAEYVANILFQPLVGTGTGQFPDLTSAAYGFLNAGSDHFFPNTSNAKTSTLFFSNCLPGISGGCATTGYVPNFDSNNYVYAPDGRYLLGNLGGAAYLYTPIAYRALTYSTNSASLPASSLVQTFGGGNVAIKAAVIDVNAKIVVGRPADQSVTILASVQSTLSTYRQQYLASLGAGGAPNPIYNIPGLLTPVEAATRGVGTAVYDAAHNQIIVTDTNASSSGGRLTMNGAIISTSTFGNIEVNGGLGQVTISNQTSIPMVVNKVNTGNLGLDGTVVSTVKITDTLRPVATNTTTYRYTAGQGVFTYVTGNGDDPILAGPNATQVSPLNASGLVQYNPVAGARLQWVQQAQLTRALTDNGAGQWSWVTSADQPNNPWFFVAADALTNPNYSAAQMTALGNVVSQAHPQGIVVLPGDAAYPGTSAKFTQTITGGVTTQTSSTQDYHFSGFSLAGIASFVATSAAGHSGDSDDTTHTFNLPTALWLKVTSSVKADNAFNVTFKGGTVGSVTISSNSAVTLADQLTNSSGQTRITAAGSITQGADAFVRTKSLILDASGGQGAAANNATSGIGTAARPFAATLNGGVVNAQAGIDGIYMNLSGTSTVGKVAAVDARGYGDVSYTKSGDILAVGGADAVPVNFIGSNITLNSIGGQVGTFAAPIVLSANSKLDQNQIVTGGVVNINAQTDINITQKSVDPNQQRLDLRLGTLTSLSGDVNVTVVNGALVDARGQTSASALSPDQVNAIAQLLHLTASAGASQAAIDRSVKPFEASITNNYGRYFRLKSDACTTGCSVFVVPASAIQLYRPLAAAALQNASLTDAQVADYITTLHQTNGTLNLSDTALALYRPLAQAALGLASVTDDQVRAYADSQYQGIVQNFQRAYGAGWAGLSQFTTQRANFAFTVNDADALPGLQAALTARAVWDPAQLVAGIDQTAFQPVSPTVGNGTPNIVGRNVTLNVGGSLGVLAAPVPIALSSLVDGGNGLSLTDQQKAAIAAANTPGSVTPVGVDGNGATVKGFSISSIPTGVTVTGVEISQQAPIFVAASGTFSANATAAAFVQSTGSSDFKIGQVVAGGDVALTATKNLVAASNNGVALYLQQVLTNGNLALTAGNGDIGSSGLAFSYKADGHLTAAQASGNVYVASYGAVSGAGGDMTVGRVFASGTASLTAMTGDILGYLGGLAITGHDVVLNAVAGSIGAANSPLQIQTNGGQLTATAAFGDVYVFSPTVTGQVPVPLSIASITANGAIVASADMDLTALSLVSATGDITVGSGGKVKVVNAVTSAQGGSGAITVTALGDIEIGSLTAPGLVKAQANGAFTLDAGGALTSSGTGIDLRAASVTMQANTLLSALTTVSVVTTTGDASLVQVLAGADVTVASGGALALAAAGSLTSSNEAVALTARVLNMGTNSVVSAAKTVSVATTGDAVLGKLVSLLVPASPNTTAISVTAGDAVHPGQILGNGDGQLNFATQRPNAAVILSSASGIGTDARPMTMDANWLSASTIAGEIHIAALGSIHVKNVSAPGGIDLTATGGVSFDAVKGDSLVLKSNGALDLQNVEVTTSLTLSGTSITGTIIQTPGAPGPLIVSITGPNGTVAQNVSLVIDPPATVIPQLLAVDATITNVGPSFTILNGTIAGQFTLNMLGQTYVMNNRSPVPMGWPTVQLYQFNGAPFTFSQNGNYTTTSGFIVDYGLLANTTALSVFNGISFVRDVPRDMWNGNPFEQEDGTEKKGSTSRIWGATPSAVLDGLKLPKAVETIGNGPALNIKGLR